MGVFTVSDASDYGDAPRKDPLCYPGERPDFSYLLHEKKVHELRVFGRVWDSQLTWKDGTCVLHEVLEELGHPHLENWYCLLAYGSNGCPQQLVHKGFDTVVVIKSRMFGIQPVYAGYMSDSGYIPGTLAREKEAEVETWVTLLKQGDLGRMDRSEGRPKAYQLVEVNEGKLFLENGKEVRPVYAYVTTDAMGLFLHGGKLIPLFDTEQRKVQEWMRNDKLKQSVTRDWLSLEEVKGKPPKVFGDMI